MVDLYKKWERNITHEESEHKDFREAAQKALKVYELDKKNPYDKSETVFPILRNVVEVQTGLITSKQPQAKLSKRFDNDQTQICMKLEKGVNYFVETGQMQSEATEAYEDFLTSGLGLMRVMYDDEGTEVTIQEQQMTDPMTGQPYIQQIENEDIIGQRLWAERVEWCNFHWQPCNRWSECDWIAFSKNFTLAEFRREYKVYPKNYTKEDHKPGSADIKVYEIWDRLKQTRYFYCDMHSEILDEDENPLGTDYFYPCAEPMFFGTLHDKYEPRPEFHFWESMHNLVQKLSVKEAALIEGVEDIEFYDKKVFSDATRLENAKNGDKIPVDMSKYQMNGGSGSINDFITPKDHSGRVAVLDKITEKRNEILDKIYQTTGIADIMQGVSDPRETARAQGYKNSWGNARLSRKRYIFDNHVRGTIEIMINAMSNMFTLSNLSQTAGIDYTPEEYQYLQQSDEYRVDVETLSTLSVDKDRDQQNAVDMMAAVSGLFMQGTATPAPLTQALLKNTIKTFPDGRELEEVVDSLPQYLDQVQQLQQQLQQMQQQNQQLDQQMMAMAGELNNYNQIKAQKDAAEAAKKQAEVAKVQADTEQTRVETAQTAAGMLVPPDAIVDERMTLRQTGI